MWIAFSDDLLEWPEADPARCRGRHGGSRRRSAARARPSRRPYGWFVIYHGVSKKDDAYRVGAVLLDLDDPTKILARTKEPILEPEFDYETSGVYNGCVFPTGNVVKDGVLYVYYGAADKFVCVATCDFEALLQDMITHQMTKKRLLREVVFILSETGFDVFGDLRVDARLVGLVAFGVDVGMDRVDLVGGLRGGRHALAVWHTG
ncbi:MAG: hypothetical protein MZW92_02635 [Comamonadaceae bacterium]|nr:hypothetical protein [Comamonadaceae bacterium]